MTTFKIVLRRTEDWTSLDKDTYFDVYHPYIYPDKDCQARMRRNMDYWHTLPINFFEYRQKVKECAIGNWHLPVISLEEALELNDPDTILIPMDDDDIVCPDIADRLYDLYQHDFIDSVSWDTWIYCPLAYEFRLNKAKDIPKNDSLVTPSNCYSIRSSLATRLRILNHRYYSEQLEFSKLFIPAYWSVRFLHPAGMWIMQKLELEQTPVYPDITIPDELRWAQGFLDGVRKITESAYFDSKNP